MLSVLVDVTLVAVAVLVQLVCRIIYQQKFYVQLPKRILTEQCAIIPVICAHRLRTVHLAVDQCHPVRVVTMDIHCLVHRVI